MNIHSSRLASLFATATLFQLAACGDDPGATDGARFAGASLAQKERAVAAAAGLDAAIGILAASTLELTPNGSTCPRITRAGDTLTANTGCTDEDGNKLSGRVVAKNLPSFFGGGHDPSRPTEVTFEGYRIDGPDQDLALDGKLIIRPDGSQTAALTATLSGIEVATDATWRPAAGELFTADAGSTIEITGLGLAEIEGQWSMDEDAPSGVLSLHGADVLEADFSRAVSGCVPLTIDGQAAGQLCDK